MDYLSFELKKLALSVAKYRGGLEKGRRGRARGGVQSCTLDLTWIVSTSKRSGEEEKNCVVTGKREKEGEPCYEG